MVDICVAYLLWLFLGIWGIHRFYLNRPVSGLLYLFTGAFLGIGWIIDFFLIPVMVEEENAMDQQIIVVQNTNVVQQQAPMPQAGVAYQTVYYAQPQYGQPQAGPVYGAPQYAGYPPPPQQQNYYAPPPQMAYNAPNVYMGATAPQ